jgi:nucleotide-binding universal stress UspA family protein
VYATVLGPSGSTYERISRQEAAAFLAHVARSVPPGVPYETRPVSSSSVARGLHRTAEQKSAEVIVVGPTHRGPATRALLGDAPLDLAHDAPCAVAVAPPGYAGSPARSDVVGVGYVATPEGREALGVATALAGRRHTRLRILVAGDRRRGEQLLEQARAVVGSTVPVETVLLEGVDAAALLRTASEDLDLLVMGSRGRGTTCRVLLGSTSAHVVHQAACPVLLVPRGAYVPRPRPIPAQA